MIGFQFVIYCHINKPLRIYAILCHARIIPEQNASKIVKNISIDGEVMAKIKVACFFLGHGDIIHHRYILEALQCAI